MSHTACQLKVDSGVDNYDDVACKNICLIAVCMNHSNYDVVEFIQHNFRMLSFHYRMNVLCHLLVIKL